jgi:hypothetical protein
MSVGLTVGCGLLTAGDWLTFGPDAQRSGLVRNETLLNQERISTSRTAILAN